MPLTRRQRAEAAKLAAAAAAVTTPSVSTSPAPSVAAASPAPPVKNDLARGRDGRVEISQRLHARLKFVIVLSSAEQILLYLLIYLTI